MWFTSFVVGYVAAIGIALFLAVAPMLKFLLWWFILMAGIGFFGAMLKETHRW